MTDRQDAELERRYAQAERKLDAYYDKRRRRGPPILLGTLLALTLAVGVTTAIDLRRLQTPGGAALAWTGATLFGDCTRYLNLSVPDVGVVRLVTYEIAGKRVLWVPMFAANDRESVILTFELLQAYFPAGATVIGILNNRLDRGRRAELFAEVVPRDLSSYLDHVITFGAYEDTVTRRMVGLGYPASQIHNLGETTNPSLDDILATIAGLIPGKDGVLIGMVNIHTHQAEMLMEHFAHLRGGDQDEELEASRDPGRLPQATRRVRRAAGHQRRRPDDVA